MDPVSYYKFFDVGSEFAEMFVYESFSGGSNCSLSLRRAAHGSKRIFLELIHGLFIT